MSQGARVVATTILVVALSGCYSLRFNASSLPDDAVSMTSVSSGQEGRHFVTKQRAGFMLWGLLPLQRLDLSRVIQQEARGHRVVNLQIQTEMAPVEGLLWLGGSLGVAAVMSLFGLGAVAPLVSAALVPSFQTITIEGDLVQDAAGR